ncbi:5-formyltetrahydrofolate cyclo-ligase [Methylophaga lonarensis MPL]|uniref:5-formyltetrahydrofolate cyclo-ligase n=1 Tax=Methylophaga lonarensis MPL TaxID=1286106 RepID=M7PUA4_9GAMM|nr:5-formyltetrahydrofolate cyclo-ligase [Methylophaga lonarensis]EMR14044.1 5-formyltetrahydrofolate cyclo-ligase [Methylophaga lonarensis MPL]
MTLELVKAWRQQQREQLIRVRQQLSLPQRQAWQRNCHKTLSDVFAGLPVSTLGFYWPIRAEPDCRDFVAKCSELGWKTALPVIQTAHQALIFRLWTPDSPMENGPWDIPIPKSGDIIEPDVLLIPLVGFDAAGYRLGYGGGFYDRTLASRQPKPLSIGLGIESSFLDSIHPQPHDIRLDIIITEAGLRDFRQ